MNIAELETVGKKLVASGGQRDKLARRRLNTDPNTVANITASEIEKGQVTIETLENLNTMVYLYSTQATIHGKLPDITNRHDALGYKSIIQNANGTLGIRYTAIDAVKKNDIAKKMSVWRETGKESTISNSTDFLVYRPYGQFTRETAEQYKEALAKAQADLEAMPKCFYGDARVMQTNCWGVICIYLVAYVGAIHTEDVDELVCFFTGHTAEETATKMEANRIKREQEKIESDARYEQQKKDQAEAYAKAVTALEETLKDNPPTGYKGFGGYLFKHVSKNSWENFAVKSGTVTYSKHGDGVMIKYGKEKGTVYTQERFDSIVAHDHKKLWKIEETTAPKKETTKQETAPTLIGTTATMTENAEKKGLELRFAGKPSEPILQALKANGWRWSMHQKMWYNRANPTTLEFAKSIAS